MMFDKLSAPFPQPEIHWRAQTLTKSGDKAMALAYIDARDVMRRLDDVVGPANWTDSYVETRSGRVICTLAICTDGSWISKSDGAGDTAVEGEKGGLSDAFKRAAVKWGIGRYLYALGAVWVPCETWEGTDGKPRWKRWTADPWTFVRTCQAAAIADHPPTPHASAIEKVVAKMQGIWDLAELGGFWNGLKDDQPGMQSAPGVAEVKNSQKAAITNKEAS